MLSSSVACDRDLFFLLLNTLLKIIMRLFCHFHGKSLVFIRHFLIRIRDMNVTAPRFTFHPPKDHGNPLSTCMQKPVDGSAAIIHLPVHR